MKKVKNLGTSIGNGISGCLLSSLVKVISLTALLLGVAGLRDASAQIIDVVWSKTYGNGHVSNIKSNSNDGGYIAAGRPWNSSTAAGLSRLYGLVLEFDEWGTEIRRATAQIPASYISNHSNLTRAEAIFRIAFKTNDGGILAFGQLYDYNAPDIEKGPDWNYEGMANVNRLKNGAWIVKFDANLNVTSNTLVRGQWIIDGWQTSDGRFVIVGGDDATAFPHTNITMLRKYNQDGSLLQDLRADYREITSIYKFPTLDDFIAVTPDRLLKINGTNTMSITNVTTVASLSLTGNGANFRLLSISPSSSGAIFINADLNHVITQPGNYNNGNALYKLNSSYVQQYYKGRVPADTIFRAPLLLPGGSNKYIGTASSYNSSGVLTNNIMYELTDNGTTYSYRKGAAYPNNTALNAVSQSDGFFSCGSSTSGLAAIAKLSTCSDFILNSATTKTICSGTAVGYTATSSSTAPVTFSWTRAQVTGITPNTGSGASASINETLTNSTTSPINVTYIIRMTYGGCTNSQSFTVTVRGKLDGGKIGSNQSICYNEKPEQLTNATSPSGGATLSYQWQSRTGSNEFTNVSGANNVASYAPDNLTVTTQYRRMTTSSSSCGTAYSDTVTITVYDELDGGTIGSNKSICHNTSPGQLTSSKAADGGTGTRTYQWEYSTDGGNSWTVIAGTNSTAYTPGDLTATTQYRRKATNDCGEVNSNTVTVTVYGQLTGGTIDSDKSICHNTSPGQLTSSENAGGGTGTRTYQWEYSTDNGSSWTVIASSNSTTYTPGNLTVTTQYRRKATNDCGSVNSNTVTVTVYGKLNQGAAQENQAICYNTVPNTLLGGAPGGGKGDGSYSYQWQQSNDDGANWTDVSPDGTSANYQPPALTQTLKYRRIVSSDGGSCGRDTSNVLTVKVYPQAILNYPDFRIWACPVGTGGEINLSKYLDTVELQSVAWGPSPAIDPSTGIIEADKLVASGTYTYTYTVTNPCIRDMTRKVYLKMLKGNSLKQPQDTIVICYEKAEAININQIFGIDAGGEITWSPTPAIDAYITRSTSPTYNGAVVMNGKGIYEDSSINPDPWHGIPTAKKVVFTYTPDNNSCLAGKTYKIVIILTPNMM